MSDLSSTTVGGPQRDALVTVLAGVLAVRLAIAGHPPHVADAAFALVLAAVALGPHIAGRSGRPAGSGLILIALLVAGWGIVTSWHPGLSLSASPAFLSPFLAWAAVAQVEDRAPITAAIVGGAAVSVSVAAWQRLIAWPDAIARADELQLPPDVLNELTLMRPFGLSVSPDLLGAVALSGLLLGASLALSSERAISRGLAGAGALVGLLGVGLSRSAGCLVAAGVALVIVVLCGRSRQSGIALLGLAAVGAAAFGFRGLDALKHSVQERLLNWSVARRIFLDEPEGVGLYRFTAAYLEHRPPEANVTRYAHSLSLQWTAELGVIGLLFTAGLLLVVLVLALGRAKRASSLTEALVLGAFAALATRTFFDYDAQIGQTGTLLGAVAALALAPLPARGPLLAPAKKPSALSRVLAALFLTGLLIVGGLNWERHRVLAPFEKGAEAPTWSDVQRLWAYADAHPEALHAGVLAATLRMNELGRCRSDCDALETELQRQLDELVAREHPPAEAFITAGRLAAHQGEPERAIELAEEATRRDPSSVDAHTLVLRLTWAADHPRLEPALERARRHLYPSQVAEAFRRAGLPPD